MNVDTSSQFGDELRARRREAGLSQEALAERSGLSTDAVAALERGRRRHPRAQTIRALADGLGLSAPAVRRMLATADGISPPTATLPGLPGTIVGRERERLELVGLLTGPASQVTVTGPGGVGKTRLALAVAYTLAESAGVTVRWASLGPVVDPAAVPGIVGAAFGVRDTRGSGLAETVRDRGGGPTVLVMDNCEHVLSAVTPLCEELCAIPDVRILATSREALGVRGEVEFPLLPLSVPDAITPQGALLAALHTSSATRLFLDRARMTTRRLTLDPTTVSAIRTICGHLDGLPLAIELVAARMGRLSASDIAAELAASLHLVRSDSNVAEQRHRTLDAAFDWSYDLLSPAEKMVFARLSVASGGWTPAAAREFAAGGGVSPDDVMDLTTRLMRKSLVVRSERGARGRYAMLRVVRMYAAARLEASGESSEVRARHANYYSSLAEAAAPHLRGQDQRIWLDRLGSEAVNLRTALRYWRESGDTDRALRTATDLWRFAYLRGRYTEGRDWLQPALEDAKAAAGTDPSLLAAALVAAGTLAYLQCDYGVAEEQLSDGLATFRACRDRPGTAAALNRLGSVARERGDYGRAETLHSEALALSQTIGDVEGVCEAQNYRAFLAWLTGDHNRCADLAADARSKRDGTDSSEGAIWSLLHLGISARYRGREAEAEALLHEALDRSGDVGYVEGTAWCLDQLGSLAASQQAAGLAWDLQHESLILHAQLGDRWRAASVLDGLAATAALSARPGIATQLCATADELRRQIGVTRPPCEVPVYDRTAAAIGPDSIEAARLDANPARLLLALAEGYDVDAALRR